MINKKIYNSHQSQFPGLRDTIRKARLSRNVSLAQIAKEPAPYPVLGPRGFFA